MEILSSFKWKASITTNDRILFSNGDSLFLAKFQTIADSFNKLLWHERAVKAQKLQSGLTSATLPPSVHLTVSQRVTQHFIKHYFMVTKMGLGWWGF